MAEPVGRERRWPSGIMVVLHTGETIGTTLAYEGEDADGVAVFAATPNRPLRVDEVAHVHIRRLPGWTESGQVGH